MQLEHLFVNIDQQIANKNYSKALENIEKAEKLLQEKTEIDLPQLAYLYDTKRFSLYELGKKEEALTSCQEAIEKLQTSANWAYLPEYNMVRGTLRACYNMLAWDIQKKAQTEEELQPAIEFINKCFSTIDPIEDKSVLKPFYDTRALVFQKAYALNPDKYQILFFESLEKLEKSQMEITEKILQDALKQEDYLTYKKSNPIEALKQGPKGETWQKAFERYSQLLAIVKPSLEQKEIAEWYEVKIKEKETPERIQAFEQKCNCTIPEELKKLYLDHGAFSIKDSGMSGSIDLYSNKNSSYDMPNIGGLVEIIQMLWGDRPEFEENFSTEEIKFLNENYFIFGHYSINDNAFVHYYFDRKGKFGAILYDQDYFDEAYEDYFQPLLKKSLATMDFNELISSQVDESITQLLEDEAE